MNDGANGSRPAERRRGERRKLADRRFVFPVRSGFDRRERRRRTRNEPVEEERRVVLDRRGSDERRLDDRRDERRRGFGDRRSAGSRGRVLLLEGEGVVRQGIRAVVEGAGYDVLEARDARAALQASLETPSHVVITNMALPDMDGAQFVRQLLVDAPSCVVIATTGRLTYGAPDPVAQVKTYGDVRTLRRPFAPERLVDMVLEAMA